MSGAYPRRSEHPYRVEKLDDLPANLRSLAEPALALDDSLRMIFVSPAQRFLRRRDGSNGCPEQALLFTARSVIHVIAASGSGQVGQTTCLQAGSILYLQLSLLLLYGRLEICGLDQGSLTTIVMEYNTVGQSLLQPELQRFLRLVWAQTSAQPPTDGAADALFDALGRQSYKFRGGLRLYALQPDENLVGYVFQPEIVKRYGLIFRHKLAFATLFALTDRELIIIEDDSTSYGWIITFCPRDNIAQIALSPAIYYQDVCVQLGKGAITVERRAKLGLETGPAWDAFWRTQRAHSK